MTRGKRGRPIRAKGSWKMNQDYCLHVPGYACEQIHRLFYKEGDTWADVWAKLCSHLSATQNVVDSDVSEFEDPEQARMFREFVAETRAGLY